MNISSRELVSLSGALQRLHNRFSCSPRVIRIPVHDSYGKITAEALISPFSVPAAHLSTTEGIAVKARDTVGATRKRPIVLTDVLLVHPGNVIPEGFDAVIMTEDAEEHDGSYYICSSAHPGQHIRTVGEEIIRTEMILPRMSLVRAVDIWAMARYGISEVPVLDLKVALIPTGNGIVQVESTMHMAAALIAGAGVRVAQYPSIPDEQEQIRAFIEEAITDNDIVIIVSGSLTGTSDYTADAIRDLGTVFVHGVAMKPPGQVILGDIRDRPVIGIPVCPIECYTIIREIILPLLGWYGFFIPEPDLIPARLTGAVQSSPGTEEFVLAIVGKMKDRWVATPLSQGTGLQTDLVRSNAYLKIPADQEKAESGSKINAILTVRKSSAEQIVLITGSHDPAIDYLSDLVRDAGILIASSHVGSMGGLITLKEGNCHLAPMHLFSDDGEYNIPYLQKYLPDQELVLICVAEREQGIVSREVLGFDDITTHRYINRQKGSGTRLLFDHLLALKGISPDSITGYNQEVMTHLGVCLAVQNGDADLGMAVYGAARAFSLPFIQVALERYEFVTTRQIFEEDSRIRTIAEVIASQKFKEVLIHLGGYEMEKTGTIRRLNLKKGSRGNPKKKETPP